MIGDVTATIGLYQFGTDIARVDEHICSVGPDPEGKDVRVLHDQQVVPARTAEERPLKGVRVPVVDPAEPAN